MGTRRTAPRMMACVAPRYAHRDQAWEVATSTGKKDVVAQAARLQAGARAAGIPVLVRPTADAPQGKAGRRPAAPQWHP